LAMRIAVDLDGVLADMETELIRQAEALFGEPAAASPEEVAPARSPDALGGRLGPDVPESLARTRPHDASQAVPIVERLRLSGRQEDQLWRHVRSIENFWESLAEIEPGAVARLALAAADRRWEVLFITKRPDTAGATAQVQTQRWLQSRGFPLPSVCVVSGSRGLVAAALALDAVIDDRVENCLDIAIDSAARAILVWPGDAGTLPSETRRVGISVVKSFSEGLAALERLDAARRAPRGMIGIAKRLVGLP